VNSPWPRSPKIVVLSGPGLSRASGFAPFDAAGMPPGLGLEDVVTREGFERKRAQVLDFYNVRRRQLMREVRPNLAHEGLAVLEMARRNEVLILTRNIDDLHERAGSLAVLHTHGELLKARCEVCGRVSQWPADIAGGEACPVCSNEGHLRPHIVRVGEAPLRMDTVYEALSHCEVFAVIGISVAGEPAAGFLRDAKRAGARTLEFVAEPTLASAAFDESVGGPLTETVPQWVKRLVAGL